jgi:hypothetical protein
MFSKEGHQLLWPKFLIAAQAQLQIEINMMLFWSVIMLGLMFEFLA